MARHFEHETTHKAYAHVLHDVMRTPDYICAPRGQCSREVVDYSFTVERPTGAPIVTQDDARNAVIKRYTAAEFDLYARGERQVSEWSKIAKMWERMDDGSGNIGSAYGWLLWYERSTPEGMTQWQWCRNRLVHDPETRQAVFTLFRPLTQRTDNPDVTCTLHGQFLLRDGALRLSVAMRSNDVVTGLVYDMPWFCHVQAKMAQVLGAKVGPYTHRAGSMHIYSRDIARAEAMLWGKTIAA